MFQAEQSEGFWVVRVQVPQIVSSNAAQFKKVFEDAVTQHRGPVILDLTETQFVDSSGLAAIVFCFKSLALRSDLVLCGIAPRVRTTLSISNMDRILKIFETVEDAIASLSGGSTKLPPA